MNKSVATQVALLCAALVIGSGAQAARGPSIGNATVDDVTLNKDNADALAFSQVNPAQFGGNASGFASVFSKTGTGSWSVLETVTSTGTLTDTSALFNFTFTKDSTGKAGTWTITNVSKDKDATLDLSLAIHASNASTAFLFDNQSVAAGKTLNGTWDIEWLNNGGNVPSFSNLVLFGRDLTTTAAQPTLVPEPATLPMLGAGLVLLGAVARRRKNNN
ncbi:putative secreted protein with PEP-CTERM sorting signal [Pseudoduganella flava]|uniref:PEP-CTERM sorting domain-containing protein n=1 Tax=Pseudoduganella flava TaxID=871742 RepID=A0A562PVI8_9BURK|nr:PEP-CTERM sorting domain-containing protein [Pseudoduganella flava]QGZ39541.1 PEP-CTERM sorting domain-containing protein [Pseudoduganella flava]TWI48434.1 putative secreted protein with PEP-CTERM sorting signal [Pseudoduganella flava]